MGDKTAIEWSDATWNPTVGCAVVSPGCTNCYAMRMAARIEAMGGKAGAKYAGLTQASKAGPVWTGAVRLDGAALDQPLRWRRPRRVFVNSMSDLFHEDLPDEAIDRVFAVMALASQHVFQVLTKRPERMREYLTADTGHWDTGHACGRIVDIVMDLRTDTRPVGPLPHIEPGAPWWPLQNVWLGVSVEDQRRADERIPILLDTPAAVRWISAEPLLGPLDLRAIDIDGDHEILPLGAAWLDRVEPGETDVPHLDWVVAGGESGPGARPMHPDWARSLRDQCVSAGVPYLFKQWGEFSPSGRVGKRAAGRALDGRTWDQYPGGVS